MPYIEDADRERVLGDGPKTAGELNFAFTYLILEYIDRKGECYQHQKKPTDQDRRSGLNQRGKNRSPGS